MADDIKDPRDEVMESCKHHCVKYFQEAEECAKRIEGKKDAHCTQQYFELWHCLDHCAKDKLFSKLK